MKNPQKIAGACLNCSTPLAEGSNYCHSCGQKNTDGKTSIIAVFGVFFRTLFNFDSRLFKTIKLLFLPGKLTSEFFAGKHKSYIHPLRLFIVGNLFLIASISYSSKTWDLDVLNLYHEKIISYKTKKIILNELDTIALTYKSKYPDPEKIALIDSLSENLKREVSTTKDSIDLNQVIIISEDQSLVVANDDLINLSIEELFEKYKVKGFTNQLMFRQKIKIMQEGKQFVNYFIGQITIMALLMMPLLAFILKIFYIRRKRYYIEHLILSFHIHTFIFLVVGLMIIFNTQLDSNVIPFILLGLLGYILYSIKQYYKQSFLKSLVKFLIISVFYFIIFASTLVAVMILSILLF